MPNEEMLAAFRRGDDATAERLGREEAAAAAERGDHPAQIDALCMLARVALRDGRFDDVERLATEARELADRTDDPAQARIPLHMQAAAARMAGRYDEARRRYEESIALNASLGHEPMVAAENRNLAYLELRAGNVPAARERFAEWHRLFAAGEVGRFAPYLKVDEATLAELDGDRERAAAALREADELFEAQGVVPDPDDAAEIARLRELLDLGSVRPAHFVGKDALAGPNLRGEGLGEPDR